MVIEGLGLAAVSGLLSSFFFCSVEGKLGSRATNTDEMLQRIVGMLVSSDNCEGDLTDNESGI
jgi:hypothetical protein